MSETRPLRAYANVDLGRQRSPQHASGPYMTHYLRAANVKDGALDLSDIKSMNFDPSERARFSLAPGDVLVTEGSGSLSAVGASAVWNAEIDGRVCFQNTLLRLRPKASTDPRFLGWWCRHKFADGVFASIATGANIHHVSADRVRALPMTYIPLAEQRAIANYLDTETTRIDALITKKRRLITLLEELRSATTLSGVTGTNPALGLSTSPSSLPWASQIAEGFDEVLLRLVAVQGTGHTPSREHPEWWVPEKCKIPWITTGEVRQMRSDRIEYLESTRECISEVGEANSSAERHPAETVVLCRTASAGYSAIMGRTMATSQDFATWTCGPLLSPRYLLLCLRAMRQDLLGRLATGSTHKTIYMPDIQALRIPLPPLAVQEQLVDWTWSRLHSIDGASSSLTRQIDLLIERRQALITAAVTGELAVPCAA